MADVLIVCVREDEPQAKALADMFEAAGFSIGGAPSSDGALRSCGAGVVVWSQASIRSRPFLDAAQRVINADKAVVASLIEPPPPSSIGRSPAFDLSRWDGDPNDPALDPLFFAVDRMVNAARAGVGAAQRETRDYEPPPAPRQTAIRAEPPPRRQEPRYRAPPPEPPPSYRVPPSSDPLGSEAEHWRAIRDSRNPADFMDYLARYGPDGAFSEVAELRLEAAHRSGRRALRRRVRLCAHRRRRRARKRRQCGAPSRRRHAAKARCRRRNGASSRRRKPHGVRRSIATTRAICAIRRKVEGGAAACVHSDCAVGRRRARRRALFWRRHGQAPRYRRRRSKPRRRQTHRAAIGDGILATLEEAPSVPLSQAVTARPDRRRRKYAAR